MPRQEPRTAPADQPPAAGGPAIVVLVLRDLIDQAEIPGLCERARTLLESDATAEMICDVGDLTQPDAVAVDALARLQLIARRLGREVRLDRVCPRLQELIALVGLSDVLPAGGLGLEPRGEAEEREEPLGVEEEADPTDPPV